MRTSHPVEVAPAEEVYLHILVQVGKKKEIGRIAGTHSSTGRGQVRVAITDDRVKWDKRYLDSLEILLVVLDGFSIHDIGIILFMSHGFENRSRRWFVLF